LLTCRFARHDAIPSPKSISGQVLPIDDGWQGA
jgi:hypothetical protein